MGTTTSEMKPANPKPYSENRRRRSPGWCFAVSHSLLGESWSHPTPSHHQQISALHARRRESSQTRALSAPGAWTERAGYRASAEARWPGTSNHEWHGRHRRALASNASAARFVFSASCQACRHLSGIPQRSRAFPHERIGQHSAQSWHASTRPTSLISSIRRNRIADWCRPGKRKVLEAGPGVRMELLAWGNTVMEPHLFRIAPRAGSGESYTHEGEEFLHVLRGQLHISVTEVSTS